ncbi:glycoside hydrolase family 43 protein [Chaetomium sp. MPI-CAGE-AT-0009]|nr:glycoside hydrolase family 43 protein [Chaetomium sp. MPI-CAGE-AT-0009]
MIPLLIPTYLLVVLLLPRPTTLSKTPLLALNFPDPCIIQDIPSGTWYAFATGWWTPNATNTTTSTAATTTSSTYRNIQAASAAHPTGPWTYLPSADPLPSPGNWTAGTGSQTWAPSIAQLTNSTTNTTTTTNNNNTTTYVLYYAAQLTGNHSHLHCVGAATTTNTILGPYTPLPSPLLCPLDRGGAIDPAAFRDPADGRRYVLYKIDGNALGGGGECNNGVAPYQSTPIVLQEVDAGDGVGLVGEGVEVLDREDVDGPLVEAPDLVRVDGDGDGDGGDDGGGVRYVLFYSNHCWDEPEYSVHYAVAEGNISGPYVRADGALIQTGDGFNITAPGSAASGGGWMLFHGDCPEGRCLFGAEMEVVGSNVTVS